MIFVSLFLKWFSLSASKRFVMTAPYLHYQISKPIKANLDNLMFSF